MFTFKLNRKAYGSQNLGKPESVINSFDFLCSYVVVESPRFFCERLNETNVPSLLSLYSADSSERS